MTAMQDLKEDLELAIDSANDALNDIIDETTRSRCKIVVKITIGDILKRINNELLETEKKQIIESYNKGQKDFANYDPERHGNECKEGKQYYNSNFAAKVEEAGI